MSHVAGSPPPDATPSFSPRLAGGLFVRGVVMGVADVIPGVSGGTIAFITGIYERFINALKSLSPAFLVLLVRGRVRESRAALLRIHWAVLVPLFGGIGAAIVLFSKIITGLMEDHPGPTYGFFFGLILASAWAPFAKMRKRTLGHGAAALAAAIGAYLFVGLQAGGVTPVLARADDGAQTVLFAAKLREPADAASVMARALELRPGAEVVLFDPKAVTAEPPAGARVIRDEAELELFLAEGRPLVVLEESRAPLWWIMCCGALAISAMILPGVSGSFLLLFLGQYHAVYGAIGRTLDLLSVHLLGRAPDPLLAAARHAWWEDLLLLAVFGVGVVGGMALFSRVVSWLFVRAHDLTMAALTGMMIGALRVPWGQMWSAGERTGHDASRWAIVAGVTLAGVAIVVGLGLADSAMRRRALTAPAS